MSIFLLDKNKGLIGAYEPLEHDQDIVLNGLITASAILEYSPEMEDAHYFGAKDVDNENIFWVYYITLPTKKGYEYNLKGVHLMFHELQGEIVKDIRPSDALASATLEQILSGSVWQVGNVDTAKRASKNYYYVSKLSAYQDFLETWDVECMPRITWSNGEITGRYIDVYDRLSADYGKWYEYGDKLLTVEAESARDQIYTALVGRGKGEETDDGFGRRITFESVAWSVADGDPLDKPTGQDYLVMPDAVDEFGLRIGIVEFRDLEDPAEVLQATYSALQETSRPKVTFSASAVEVGMLGLGETVAIIRDDLGIRYKTHVFEIKRNFLDKNIKAFKLGDRPSATVADRLAQQDKETKDQEETFLSYLTVVRNEIIGVYFDEDGYNYDVRTGNEYDLPAGYYSFDRPIDQDPSKVVYMGAGKILVANAKLPNNTWDWRTAIDGDGVVADVITSGMLKGGNVKWNLEDGTLLIGESVADHQLYYDGVTLSIKGKIYLSSGELLDDEFDNFNTEISNMGVTITENTVVDGLPVSYHVEGVLNDMQAMTSRMDAFEQGGGNMVRNPNLGMPDDPDSYWWSDGNTWLELKARGLTWDAVKTAGKTWNNAKEGLI
ncbi:MAG TPA: phage tail spike protein [Bacillota bacterium]|nr:phage tail spike protein [Bacillota bacterium]